MPDTPIITRDEVADFLGITAASLTRRILDMQRNHGFPPAIPGSNGLRYSRAAVLTWIDSFKVLAPLNSASEADVITAESVMLRRARAMLPAE